MNRVVRLLSAAALLAVPLLPLPQSSAQTERQSAPSAYDEVASCLNERGHLAVLALVDESSSLVNNDPDAMRVNALAGMLHTLARYGSSGEGRLRKIEVQLAGFGTAFTPGPWRVLNESTRSELEGQARQFADRKTNNDTDFAAALLGAQGEFVRKDAEIGTSTRPPCRLLLLFTDGVYDLDTVGVDRAYAPGVPRSDLSAIMARGQSFLCDPGQLADQLRATGTVIVAIGLIPDKAGPAGLPDQGFLQSIAEREAPGRRCGDTNDPPGEYVAAGGLRELLAAFDSAINQAIGGTVPPIDPKVPVCPPEAPADARCSRQFELDVSLREFHLLLDLAAPGIVVDLIPPRGAALRLQAGQEGELTASGAGLTVSKLTDLDMVVDGDLPVDRQDWVGTWTVRFVDTTGTNAGAIARSQITVFGGLVPVVEPNPPTFQAGERTDFTIRITDAAGSPRTPKDFVRSAEFTTILVDPQGEETSVPMDAPAPDGSRRVSYDFAVDNTPSFVDLVVRLDVVTTSGLRLQPRTTTLRVPVKQPSAYPEVTPLELRLSPIIDQGAATGTLTVKGGRGGPGCVRLSGVDFERTPRDAGQLPTRFVPDATDEQRCVRVNPAQESTVEVRVEPEKVRSGLAEGRIIATLTADNEPPRTVSIPVSFEMKRQPDAGVRNLLFAAIVGGGVLLPFVLLWLLGLLTAKFRAPGLLRHVIRNVVVTPNGVFLADTGRTVSAALDHLSFLAMPEHVPLGRAARFECGLLSFRRRIPLLPWLLPHGRVQAGGRAVLAGGAGRGRKITAARVEFELNRTWVFVVDPVEPGTASLDEDDFRVPGQLFGFLSDFGLEDKAAQLLGTVELELPECVRAALDRVLRVSEPDAPVVLEDEDYKPPA